jgi:hypothetical protein
MRRFVEHPAAGMSGYLHTINRETALMGKCLSCGSQRPLTVKDLEKHRRGLDTLQDIAKRLRCSSCRAKNAKLLTGYYVGEDTDG